MNISYCSGFHSSISTIGRFSLFGFFVISCFFSVPKNVWGATTTIIYESDFSTDPEWTTDQPENFYWDESAEALFARTMNRPAADHSPSRHYYTETELNPRLSYELSWDMQITAISQEDGRSGVAVFGLYGDRLQGFNPFNINIVGFGQDGTFSMRMMTLEGQSRFVFTEVNPGFDYDIGEEQEQSFDLNRWYSYTERYDAPLHQYSFQVKDRETGNILVTHNIQALFEAPVNPELQNLGVSMHPEGDPATNLSLSTRIDGYAEYLIDNVKLTQILDETFTEAPSVLFLPGIQASRLYKDGILGTEDQVWEPNINGDVAQLEMTEAGESVKDIYTRDSIDAIFGLSDIYGSFETYLESQKTKGAISDWETFAYDWRKDVFDIVNNGTPYENETKFPHATLEKLARDNNSPITIVAHSNGGLLAKALIERLKEEGKVHLVNKIIFIASPHLGTPKAIGTILHGYDQQQLGGFLVEDETAREVIRNMPGAYGLVPSEAYVARDPYPIIEFSEASSTKVFTDAYGQAIDSSDELVEFMTGSGDERSEANQINEVGDAHTENLASAQTYHLGILDNWVAPEGITVIDIVGVGLDTVRGFKYQEFIKQTCITAGGTGAIVCAYDPYYEPTPLFTQYGDETVVATSAMAYRGSKSTYYINLTEVENDPNISDIKHVNITGLNALQQFVGGLVQNTTPSVPFIYGTMPRFTTARDLIGVHSPVSLTVTDASGNKVGRVGTGTTARAVTDIPGSLYEEITGAKYIIVPSNSNYTVELQGEDAGSFNLTIESLIGESPSTRLFTLPHATVTPNMQARFQKNNGVYSDIQIDYNGDGIIDQVTTLDGEPPTGTLYSTLRALISNLVQLKASERQWLSNAVDRAEQAGLRKGNDSNNTVRIFSQIDERLSKYRLQGLVTEVEYSNIKNIMNEIISR